MLNRDAGRLAAASALRACRAWANRRHRQLGHYLTAPGPSVAVLAVDPSSAAPAARSWATRRAWRGLPPIRTPSSAPRRRPARWAASRARRARPSCCARRPGFDVVLVETVGVGQSEVAVAGMVDFFLVLHAGGRRRRTAGHQEGRDGARRHDRHHQGRRRQRRPGTGGRRRLQGGAAYSDAGERQSGSRR